MTQIKIFLTLVSFIFLSHSNVIHEDTILQLDAYGNISGLPKEYSPAKFDLDNAYLKIKDKEILFPPCISHYLNFYKNPEIELSASWYHWIDIMPYYINIEISGENKSHRLSIIIDLESLELLEIEKITKVQIDEACLTEYKNRIKKLN